MISNYKCFHIRRNTLYCRKMFSYRFIFIKTETVYLLVNLFYNYMCHQKSQKNEVCLELNGAHQLMVCDDYVNLLDDSVNTIKEYSETLL
jgi:hypothetical protein